jgi:O-antigen ligase
VTRSGNLSRFLLYLPLLVLIGTVLAVYSEGYLALSLTFAALTLLSVVIPELMLYVLLLSTPFSFRYILPFHAEMQIPSEPLVGILAVVFAMRWLMRLMRSEVDEIRPFPLRYPLLLLVFATFISILNSPDLYVSAKGAIRATAYMMLSFVVYDLVRNDGHLKALFLSAIPSAVMAVIWTSIVLIKHIDLWQWRIAYQGSPFTNYSVYGTFLSVFLLLTLSRLLFDTGDYDRVGWGIIFAVFAGGMCLCFSRGAWLSVMIAVGALMLYRSEGSVPRKFLLILGGIMLVGVAISAPGVSSALLQRLTTFTDIRFASNKARLLRWGAALMMFLRHPIIGNGYGGFALLYKGDPSLMGPLAKYRMGAHSEYLQILSEMGILGFGAWIWLIVEFYRYGLRKLRSAHDRRYTWLFLGIMAAEGTILIHFLVNNLIAADKVAVPFWGLYGLLPAVGGMADRVNDGCAEKSTPICRSG